MNEEFVSRASIIAFVLWFLAGGLLAAAWAVALAAPGHAIIAGMLAATALGLSAVAATAHIRIFACRVSRLVRASSGQGSDARPLR